MNSKQWLTLFCLQRQQFVPKNRPNINQWFRRDVEAMAKNAEAAPIFLDAVEGNWTSSYKIDIIYLNLFFISRNFR
jgi:hypothetical protein